jgi:hypothetical protein
MDTSGHPIVVGDGAAEAPAGGVVSVQGAKSIAAGVFFTGSTWGDTPVPVSTAKFYTLLDNAASALPAISENVKYTPGLPLYLLVTVTGYTSGQFHITMQEQDPLNHGTPYGTLYTTGNITANGQYRVQVPSTASGFIIATVVPDTFVGTGASAVLATQDGAIYGLGTAGTPAGGVVSVQGVSGGTTLPVTATQGTAAALGGAWPIEITDGTHGPAAVKAASTAAVAADPAVVVAISPNNLITTSPTSDSTPATQNITALDSSSTQTLVSNNQFFVTGTPTAGSTASFAVATKEAIRVQVTGTWTGVLDVEASLDGGTTWFANSVHQTGTQFTANNFTANFIGSVNLGGCTNFRVRASNSGGWTGTATVLVVETLNVDSLNISDTIRIQGTETVGNTPITLGGVPISNPVFSAYLDSNGNVRLPTFNTVAGGGFGGPTTYSNVVTDLEGFRDDFQGTNLIQNIPGTCTFTSFSPTVTGSGTSFISALNTADIYVKLSTDPNSDFTKLLTQPFYEQSNGNTTLQLSTFYPGSTGSGTGVWTYWAPTIGSGGSIIEGSAPAAASQVALETGTTSGSYTYLQHGTHFIAPCNITVVASVSQAIANQEFAIGLVDNITSPGFQCLLIFNGTVNTQVTLRTGTPAINGGSNAIENEIGTLPNSLTTATQIRYRIVASEDAVVLFANDIPIARNKLHLPTLYNPQPLTIAAYNTGTAASSTNLIVDMIGITAHDKVEVEMATTPQPAPVQVTGFDTNGNFQAAGITPPSTAATSVSSALVVAVSPNTPVLIGGPGTPGQAPVPIFDQDARATLSAILAELQAMREANREIGDRPILGRDPTGILRPAASDASGALIPSAPLDGSALLGTQGFSPISGRDYQTIRALRMSHFGTARTTSDTILFHDLPTSGLAINSFVWLLSNLTMTSGVSNNALQLNKNATTTAGTYCILTNNRTFIRYATASLNCHFRVRSTNWAAAHSICEWGFGNPGTTTPVINAGGIFFRSTVAGVVGVLDSGSGSNEEQIVPLVPLSSLNNSTYYNCDLSVSESRVTFVMTDANGLVLGQGQIALDLNTLTPLITTALGLPTFLRVYNDAVGGTSTILLATEHLVTMSDTLTNMSWAEQMSLSFRQSGINPGVVPSVGTSSNFGSAPSTLTPANGSAGYSTLGGEYAFATVVAAETPCSIFGFQVPNPFTLMFTGLNISPPVVATTIATTGVPYIEWMIMSNASTNLLSTGAGIVQGAGGVHVAPSAAAAQGSVWGGGVINWQPKVPIVCEAGSWLHIGFKILGATVVTTAGLHRGTVTVDGYFM